MSSQARTWLSAFRRRKQAPRNQYLCGHRTRRYGTRTRKTSRSASLFTNDRLVMTWPPDVSRLAEAVPSSFYHPSMTYEFPEPVWPNSGVVVTPPGTQYLTVTSRGPWSLTRT